MPDRFIINVCLTGLIPTKQMNPRVPMTPDEIAQDVQACIELGASVVHVHARDYEQTPDWRKETYSAILQAIRKVSEDVVICVSTSGRKVSEIEKRMECLDTLPRPDMASLTMGSCNFKNDASVNKPHTIQQLLDAMTARDILPELEIFDMGMARATASLIAERKLKPPYFANLLLGGPHTASDSLSDLSALLLHLPQGMIWCAGGIGRAQLRANVLGMLYGHGVRVGLEDNLLMDASKTPATNPGLVERIVTLGNLMGKRPTSIQETRDLLGLH